MHSAGQPTKPDTLAELKTSEGTFIIQERRAVSRETQPAQGAPAHQHSSSPQMMALGGLIILGVLIGSYTTKYDQAIGHSNGPIGVPPVGFLALQLFLSRAAYRLIHDVRHIGGVGVYIRQRLLRYLPAVVPAVLLGFVLLQFGEIPQPGASLKALPANLLMMADMLGVDDVDSSHWRLKIEIFLSVLIGLTWFGPLRRHLAATLLVGLTVTAACLDGEPARQHSLSISGIATADGYLPLFAFGIALFQLTENKSRPVWWVIGAASLVLVFLSNTPWHGAVVVAALVAMAALVMGHFVWLGRVRILVALGDIAFPIYVVHFIAGFVLMHRLETFGVSPVVALLAAGGMAIALGKLFNVAFEKPAEAHLPALLTLVGRPFDWNRIMAFLTILDGDHTSRAEVPF